MLNRRPNTCTRSDVCDRAQFFAAKHTPHGFAVAKVDAANSYVARETCNVRVLNLWIVKIIEVVQDNDFMPRGEQLFGKMRPDETGATCDQDSHTPRSCTTKHAKCTKKIIAGLALQGVCSRRLAFRRTPYNSKNCASVAAD